LPDNELDGKTITTAAVNTFLEVMELARRKMEIPKYGTTMRGGVMYYRTRIEDADGKRVSLYAKTAEELYEKVKDAEQQIEEARFRRTTPTVAQYCERWLLMQSAHIRV